MQLKYTAPKHVFDVIASLGRTEDIKLCPSNRRLAIAGYEENKITIFDIHIDISQNEKRISLTDVTQVSSKSFRSPHGLHFIDDETIIVANRDGDASIIKLPSRVSDNAHELIPFGTIRSGAVISYPGSVTVTKKGHGVYEALICNNYSNCVTKHLLDFTEGCAVKSNEILLRKWLDTPDGICVSNDLRWIAISNNNAQSVLIYENKPSINELSDPDGMLRSVYCPHGLKFTSDGRFIFVADAGAPYVHIYAKRDSSWRGVFNPLASFRIMNIDDFVRGRHDPQNGGPKGIDIDDAMNVLVTTCEIQPLAFFDLQAILNRASSFRFSQREVPDSATAPEKLPASFGPNDGYCHDQNALEMRYELNLQGRLMQAEARAERAEARADQAEARAKQADARARSL
jgi:hypothetical protein